MTTRIGPRINSCSACKFCIISKHVQLSKIHDECASPCTVYLSVFFLYFAGHNGEHLALPFQISGFFSK